MNSLFSRWLSADHILWLAENSSFWNVGQWIQICCTNLGVRIEVR